LSFRLLLSVKQKQTKESAVWSNYYYEVFVLTNNFLFAHPSSNAGNSTPFSSFIALSALSGSSYSAKPNPWGLFAGVMSRLKDLIGPQACK
jgi:hypothetical protein